MSDAALAIQQLYPQVYYACHARHPRTPSNPFRISERDTSILAHVGPMHRPTAVELARHMGLGAPTMSEALARLERAGLIERAPLGRDRRRREIRLSERGQLALSAGSVLDPERLERVLARLSPSECKAVVRGLALLARAAHELAQQERRR